MSACCAASSFFGISNLGPVVGVYMLVVFYNCCASVPVSFSLYWVRELVLPVYRYFFVPRSVSFCLAVRFSDPGASLSAPQGSHLVRNSESAGPKGPLIFFFFPRL